MAIEDKPNLGPRQPFKENLKPVDFKNNPEMDRKIFHLLDSSPDKIIRLMDGLSHNDLESIKVFKGILETLKSHGINIPQVDLFAAEIKSRNPNMVASVEKVEGPNLAQLMLKPQSVEDKLFTAKLIEDLYIKLTEYLIATEALNITFMYDIYKPGDYVYGRVKGDTEDKIYLVDIDPIFHQTRPLPYDLFLNEDEAIHNMDANRQDNLEVRLSYVAHLIVMIEKKIGVKFEKLRLNLKGIMKINPNNRSVKYLLHELERKEQKINSSI